MSSNQATYGVVTEVPGLDGWGMVLAGGSERRCYFDPSRFKVGARIPEIADRVMVYPGISGLIALYVIG